MTCNRHPRPEIAVHPGIRFGEPTLAGHRIDVSMVVSDVWEAGVGAPMDSMEISRAEVLVCCWYAGTYGLVERPLYGKRVRPSQWRRRWGAWAEKYDEAFWRAQYERIPDPPGRPTAPLAPDQPHEAPRQGSGGHEAVRERSASEGERQ